MGRLILIILCCFYTSLGVSQASNQSLTNTLSRTLHYAKNGLDTSLVILSNLKNEINFEKDNDLALQFFLINFEAQYAKFRRDEAGQALSHGNRYYKKTENQELKAWYELCSIKKDIIQLEEREQEIRSLIKFSKEHKLHKYHALGLVYLSRIQRRKLNIDSTNYLLDVGLSIAKRHELLEVEALIYSRQSSFLVAKHQLEEAQENLKKAKAIFDDLDYQLQSNIALLHMGSIYNQQEKHIEALSLLQNCLKYFEDIDFKYRISSCNRLIGSILSHMRKYDQAIEKYELALEDITLEENPFQYGRITSNLGAALVRVGNFEKAEKIILESIEVKQGINDEFTQPNNYYELGNLYLAKKDYAKAKIQFENAIRIIEKTKSNSAQGQPYLGLLKISLNENDLVTALKHGEKALHYSKATKAITTQYEILSHLADITSKLGKIKAANNYYREKFFISDSVMTYNKALELSDMLAEIKEQESELKILKLKKENLENTKDLEWRKQQNKMFQLASILSLIILFLFVYNYIQSRKATKEQNKLIATLSQTNKMLLDSNEQLEQFAYIASHDLKTPLRSIVGFSSLLKKSVTPKLSASENEYLDFIIGGGKNLYDMTDDILKLAKVGSQGLKKVKTDSNKLIAEVLNSIRKEIKDGNIDIVLQEKYPVVFADELKLKRVFQNILSNAVKFTQDNSDNNHIKISYKEYDDKYKFSISDTGIGIQKTDQDLFAPFKSLNSKEEYSGTGMGLSICNKIIALHGGDIWYESEYGIGTTFHFTIPKNKVPSFWF